MILWGAFLVFLAFLIVRLIYNYSDPNPFGKIGRFGFWIRKRTERFVYPAARLLAQFRVDTRLAPLVTMFIGLVLTYFASSIIGNTLFVIDGLTAGVVTGNPKVFIGFVLYGLLSVLILFIFIRFISSWFVFTRNTFLGIRPESDRPDHDPGPETHPADRDVRYFRDDRSVADRISAIVGAEYFCEALMFVSRVADGEHL